MGKKKNNKIPILDTLNLSYCELTDEHIERLLPCIPYIETLDIKNNYEMSTISMVYISDIVTQTIRSKKCRLKLLNVSTCRLEDEHFKLLLPCAAYLVNIDISCNYPTDEAFETFTATIGSKLK